MAAEDPEDAAPRDSLRVPFETSVDLEFEDFRGFASLRSVSLSADGLFVRANDPKPPGTILSFEFNLPGQARPIRGLGEVIWVRSRDLGPEKPGGMGIRFHQIDERSRELISEAVGRHLDRGERPADPGGQMPSPSAAIPLIDDASASEEAWMPSVEIEASKEVPIDPGAASERMPAAPKFPARAFPPARGLRPPRRSSPARAKITAAALALAALGGVAYLFRGELADLLPAENLSAPAPAGGPKVGEKTAGEEISLSRPPREPAQAPPAATQAGPIEAAGPAAAAASAPAAREGFPLSSSGPATALENISWEIIGGETVVTLRGDGAIREDQVSRTRVDDAAPREVIKLTGLRRPYPQAKMDASSAHLRRIRTGFHLADSGAELHVVLDLTGRDVITKRVETDGARVRVHLGP